jgi:hypothetical protein
LHAADRRCNLRSDRSHGALMRFGELLVTGARSLARAVRAHHGGRLAARIPDRGDRLDRRTHTEARVEALHDELDPVGRDARDRGRACDIAHVKRAGEVVGQCVA